MTVAVSSVKERQPRALVLIKVLHTVIWAIIAACILLLPVADWMHRFGWAAILSGIVLVECGVLAVNKGRCPLTDLADKCTPDRSATNDIYLPNWVAKHNKVLFGTLFVVNALVVVWQWLR